MSVNRTVIWYARPGAENKVTGKKKSGKKYLLNHHAIVTGTNQRSLPGLRRGKQPGIITQYKIVDQ